MVVAPIPPVTLLQVEADDPRLDRLLQLYMHEWSALVATRIGEDARYVYPDLPLYRDRERRTALLFLDGAERRTPLGFALAARDDDRRWHVEEFFVVAGARRHGVGGAAAHQLVAAHPGPWTLTVRPENPRALAFWRATFPAAEERVEVGDDGVARTRLSFVAGGAPPPPLPAAPAPATAPA